MRYAMVDAALFEFLTATAGAAVLDTLIVLTCLTIPMLVAYTLDSGRLVPRQRMVQAE